MVFSKSCPKIGEHHKTRICGVGFAMSISTYLTNKISFEIKPIAPFHFEGTVYKPSHFPAPLDHYEKNSFWFTLRQQNKVYGIRLDSEDSTTINVNIFYEHDLSDDVIKKIISEIRFRFDLDANLDDFIKMSDSDPILNSVERKWRGMRVSCAFSLYELLCITILLQNAPVNRSVKMLATMLEMYGKKIIFNERQLFSFWLHEDLCDKTEEELKNLKVGYRAKSFLRVSHFFKENPNFEITMRKLSKQDASNELKKIYGVGPATCGYILFENLHYYDALDHISPWESKILGMVLFGNIETPAKTIIKYAEEKWGKWKMLATHYIFEDVFWRRKHEQIEWLNALIRL